MLLDGYWRKELYEIKKQFEKCCKYKNIYLTNKDKVEHTINRGLLFSAVIIRKIIDDEKEAEGIDKKIEREHTPYKILHYMVPVKEYNYIDDGKFFVNSSIVLSEYDTKNGKAIDVSLKELCNQFIRMSGE